MTKRNHRRLPHKLARYAVAAGVSLVAQDAGAGIVYTDFGPSGVGIGDAFHVDFDSDGAAEFTASGVLARFSQTCTPSVGTNCWSGWTKAQEIRGRTGNTVLAAQDGLARALSPGTLVHTASTGESFLRIAYATFYASPDATAGCSVAAPCTEVFGEFLQVQRAFLGLNFDLVDGRHAGWAEVSVAAGNGELSAIVYGYAYEEAPGRAISAGAVPEPPSLLLLAAGAAGLAALRRKRASHEPS